ncbi:hypothetical protein ACSLO9_34315, partial [Escherichia coli]
ARTERKSGSGYTGFTCYAAPDVSLEDDLKRRDLTHGIWELGNGQEKKSVKVSGHLSSNSGEIVLQWA